MRCILQFAITVVVVLIFGLAAPTGFAQEHKTIHLSGNKNLNFPFSDGVVAGNTLFVAGQEGTDDHGKLAAGGITAETKAALDNIQQVVKAAGFCSALSISVVTGVKVKSADPQARRF